MATHHIARQRLILEGSGVNPPAAGEWYARLERMQRTNILPALEAALDRIDDPATERIIERIELTIGLDDTPTQIEARLYRILKEGAIMPAPVERSVSLFADLYFFLRSGNLPPYYPDLTALRRAVRDWHPTAADWQRLFALADTDVRAFLGRGTQVQGNLVRQCWEQLVTQPESRSKLSTSTTANVSAWSAALEEAGYVVRHPTPRPGIVRMNPTHEDNLSNGTLETAIGKSTSHPAYYPENAGLILLHPYLKYLLDRVGCPIGEGKPVARSRAARLFYYLNYGDTEIAEWQLPLTKLLLGLHPDDYLEPAPALPEADRAAADELLHDVIGHWTALKNTGISTLRTAFLQRPGKLEPTPGGWRLTVERRAHDVLLERLPWTIGLVKTPWMKSLLQVDWS